MRIRKARLKDVSLIVDLWKEFMKYHDEIVIKNNKKIKPYVKIKKNASSMFRKFIQKNILSKNAIIFIVEIDDKIAGYSLNYIKNNVPIYKMDKIGYMSDLFVKKEFRGKGISTKFKNETIDWFKKKGVKHISIKVYNDNKFAHSVYKKWGFFDFQTEMRKKM